MNPTSRFLPGCALVVALVLAGCAQQETTPGVSETEVVFGISGPLSGPAAAWGAVGQGAKAWAEHVNAEGGVHGRKLRVVLKDDGYTPGRALANLTEMEEEVLATVGLVGTAVINAIKDTVAESGLPVILPNANVRVWADQPREKVTGIFVGYPDYRDEGAFLGEQAAVAAGAKSAAVFYQNDDYGKDGLEGARLGLAAAQVELRAEVPYELQDRELGLHALKLKESGAEALLLYSTPTHAANVINEMAKLDYRPTLLASTPLSDENVMFRLLGDAWAGAYVSSPVPPRGDPGRTRVVEALLRQDPSLEGRELLALVGAAGMIVAVEGLRQAGPEPTRASFLAAIEGLRSFQTDALVGPVTFGPERHHGINSVALLRMGSGPEEPPTAVVPLKEFAPLF